MSTFKIGTFNAENLFSRAKALNLKDNEKITEVLDAIQNLQKELNKATYDKNAIFDLYTSLKSYIAINEERGKLFKRKGYAIIGVSAAGRGDWSGSIYFKREDFGELTRENTAKVIKKVKADVFCVVEVEDRPTLNSFASKFLKSRKYSCNMVIDGNDNRGIDVGILSRYEFGVIRTHIFDRDGKSDIFSRDCLEIEVRVQDDACAETPVHFLLNHLKSKSGAKKTCDARRKRQAKRVAEILAQNYDLTEDYVVVAGDFNDTPDSPPLNPLMSVGNLHDVLATLANDNRWTYYYKNKFSQIDYLLVSTPLHERLKRSGVERRGMYNLAQLTDGREESFPEVTHWTNAAFDHGAVWAEFEL